MTLKTGTVLNNIYRVVKLLGKGSMGNVYLVERIEYDKKFVVKELNFSQGSGLNQDDAKEIFRREAEFMENFDHPGLPKTYGVFSQNGKEYLTMDYIEGKTLEEIINTSKKAVEKNKAITWTIQIAEIIDYLHNSFQKPLVYRDLKPSNIIIKPDGEPVLVDFGIARYYNPDKSSDTFNYGTPGYAAPEQYKGKGQSTPQSDIFGLGAILFQMLTGYDPSLKPLQFPSMKSLNSDISEELESTVFKAIQLDPMNRYISMREFKEILQKYLKNTEEKHIIWTEEHIERPDIAKIAGSLIKVPAAIMVLSGLAFLFFTILMILIPDPYDWGSSSAVIFNTIAITFIISTVTTSIISFFISLTEKITEKNAGTRSSSISGRTGSTLIQLIAKRGENFIKIPVIIMFLSLLSLLLFLLISDVQHSHITVYIFDTITVITFMLSAITTFITLIFTFIAEKITGQNRADNSVSKWDRSCRLLKITTIILFWLYIFSVIMIYRYYSSIKEIQIAAAIIFLLTILCSVLWFILLFKRGGDILEIYGTMAVKIIDYSLSASIIMFIVFSILFLPKFFAVRASGHLIFCENNIKNLATALEMYATDNNGLYPDGFYKLAELPDNKKPYINKIPDCLRSRKIYDKKHLTSYEYTVSEDFKNFTAWCIQFHQDAGIPAGYPQYNPYQGLIIK
ncbi:MAG: serine/threonine-protein kinase [Candidatus Eremiobacterota bacterium]